VADCCFNGLPGYDSSSGVPDIGFPAEQVLRGVSVSPADAFAPELVEVPTQLCLDHTSHGRQRASVRVAVARAKASHEMGGRLRVDATAPNELRLFKHCRHRTLERSHLPVARCFKAALHTRGGAHTSAFLQ
jgi:hypothetical protein